MLTVMQFVFSVLCCLKLVTFGAGEIAEWVGILAVLSGTLHILPSTHIRQLTTTYNSSSRGSSTLIGPLPGIHVCTCAHTYTHTQINNWFLFYVHWCFTCMHAWGCRILWTLIYRQLWASMWVLGIEPRSLGRAASALNCWVSGM